MSSFQTAGMVRIQNVIRWTLTEQSLLVGAVCCCARRPAYLTSLPRQLDPATLPHSKAAGASWNIVLGEGARYFPSFYPFWSHRHFLLSLGSNFNIQPKKTNLRSGTKLCLLWVLPFVALKWIQKAWPLPSGAEIWVVACPPFPQLLLSCELVAHRPLP